MCGWRVALDLPVVKSDDILELVRQLADSVDLNKSGYIPNSVVGVK